MNSIFYPFLINLLGLVITFGTPLHVSGQETQVQTLCSPVLRSVCPRIDATIDVPHVQVSVGDSECENSGSSKKAISYLLGSERVTWFQAYVLCKQSGMELASISSLQEENALENYTKSITNKVGFEDGHWLAGTRHGSSGSEFVWFTTGKPVIYRKFADGQPDNANSAEACLHIFLHSPAIFGWNDVHCDHKLGYICQSSG